MSRQLTEDLPDINLSSIDRASVRALAEAYHHHLGNAAAAGRNPHQVALDWQDKIAAYTTSLKDADAQQFAQLYVDETNALTQAMIAETARINAHATAQQVQATTGATQVTTWITLIALFVVLITMIRMFK